MAISIKQQVVGLDISVTYNSLRVSHTEQHMKTGIVENESNMNSPMNIIMFMDRFNS